MSKGLIITLVALAVLAFWAIGSRNTLAGKDQDVKAEWAKVQAQYQRRADLIPNLVKTVQGAANFEKGTLTDVINARASATQVKLSADELTPENMAKFQAAQSQLQGALSRLMAVAESYPQLKATQNFSDLQEQLESTENRITTARNDFNGVVRNYNGSVIAFPTNILAGMFGYKEKGYFEADAGSQKAPTVDFGGATK